MQAGRVIKFRAWDSERGKMVFPMVMNWWQDEGAPAFKSEFVDCDASHECTSKYLFEVDLMQFTGLRDKHGCEIYEGDHMYASGNLYGEEYIGTVVWDKDDARFEVVGLHGRFEYIPDECYVKGNIYENPELLEVGK